MRWMFALVFIAACGDNLARDNASTPSDETDVDEYYALRLGAHWQYKLGSGRILDKTITGCEEVALRACGAWASRVESAYVRETREQGTLLKVHSLRIEPGVGVVRVREDTPGSTTVWYPYDVRLPASPYVEGDQRTYSGSRCEFTPANPAPGPYGVMQIEIIGPRSLVDGKEAREVRHSFPNMTYKTSVYVLGTGEVRETDDYNPDGDETLVSFEPGFAECP